MIKIASPIVPESDIERVNEVLRCGNLVQGKNVGDLEKEISRILDARYCVAVSSGTAALHLCIKLLNLMPGDEVIAPAFTFPATTNVVEIENANIKLVDISLDDYCIDVKKLQNVISNKTKAIIIVHEFGLSADIEEIVKIAKENNLILIEDAACALGATYKGNKIGTFGDLSCFSLHPRKSITSGEGGLIVTNNPYYYERLLRMRNHGIVSVDGRIDFVEPGLNYRMTDFQAALALAQLDRLNEIIKKKTNISLKLMNGLSDLDSKYIKLPHQYENRVHTWQTFHTLILTCNRNDFIEYLKMRGIESNYGAYAIHLLSYYKDKYNFDNNDYPNAKYAYENGLAIPNHQLISDDELDFIIQVFHEYFI